VDNFVDKTAQMLLLARMKDKKKTIQMGTLGQEFLSYPPIKQHGESVPTPIQAGSYPQGRELHYPTPQMMG
jgi:hypothetical protein